MHLGYAAVQQGQPYVRSVLDRHRWRERVRDEFCDTVWGACTYVQNIRAVLPEVTSELFASPRLLEGGLVPDVWTEEYWQGRDDFGVPAAWNWGDSDTGVPLADFQDPYAGATWDGSASDLWSDLPDVGGGNPYDSDHDAFNTWMAEEWSQMLSGENPEPTWQNEAGNLYWAGPSGTLHEWSADYEPSLGDGGMSV